MSLLDVLSNPGFGNLLLLIAAIIGVYGSYWLYQLRLDDRREATRRALKAEIKSTAALDTMIRQDTIGGEPPAQILQPTTVYEGHIEEIGLLSEEEISLISEFYSDAIIINDTLRWNREENLHLSSDSKSTYAKRMRRNSIIASEIDRLAVSRWKAAQVLKKHLGEDYENIEKMNFPESAGDTVSKYHPALKSRLETLVNEGYFKPTEYNPDIYQLTEKGEEWCEDNDANEDYDLDHELSLT